jgi:tight adherence protein B
MKPLVAAALSSAILLGIALFWTMLADRRRQMLQQRLRSVVASTAASRIEPLPPVTIRRRISQGSSALGRLPAYLWSRLQAEFVAAGNSVGILHLLAAGCIVGVAIFAFATRLLELSPPLALAKSGVAAVASAIAVLKVAQNRYRMRFLDAFPDALDLVCRAVRAGLPVNEAMAVAAREIPDPVGRELRQALSEIQIGVEPDEALQKMADRVRVPDFRFYVVALSLQRRTGGGLAETLTNLSSVIRARKALRLKARALSAEARASAAVLAMLPFIVTAVLSLFNPQLMTVLFTEPRGRFMLGVAIATLVTGIITMAMIIRRSVR